MFDIGWSELVIIGVVALIAIGPKELPGVLRACGQWMGKIRRMASDFQDQFREAMREAEVADIKKQVDEMTQTASSYTNFDPIADVRNDIEGLINDKPADNPPSSTPAAIADTERAPSAAPEAAPQPDTAPPAPDIATAAAPQAPPPKAGDKAGEGA